VARQTQFRFPGRVEIRYLDALPEPGEVVLSQRESWLVVAVEQDGCTAVCMLEAAAREELEPTEHERMLSRAV
jgi:hypothetical protein